MIRLWSAVLVLATPMQGVGQEWAQLVERFDGPARSGLMCLPSGSNGLSDIAFPDLAASRDKWHLMASRRDDGIASVDLKIPRLRISICSNWGNIASRPIKYSIRMEAEWTFKRNNGAVSVVAHKSEYEGSGADPRRDPTPVMLALDKSLTAALARSAPQPPP